MSGVHYRTRRVGSYAVPPVTHNRRLRLEVSAPDKVIRTDPFPVGRSGPTNDWHERETYDFFGRSRRSSGPDLIEILTTGRASATQGTTGGIPVEYKGRADTPPDERRLQLMMAIATSRRRRRDRSLVAYGQGLGSRSRGRRAQSGSQ